MIALRISLAAAASAILFASTAFAAGVLTDAKGMTLYIFDKDTKDISNCYDACAAKWPPYLVQDGEAAKEGWSTTQRKDGSLQWVYEGKPLYYFVDDKNPGDAKGDGLNNVWHTVTE